MKIRYNEDFDCYMTTECHKTDIIELDGVKLIPITELDKIKAKIEKEKESYTKMWETGFDDVSYGKYRAFRKAIDIIVKHIDELEGENNGKDNLN